MKIKYYAISAIAVLSFGTGLTISNTDAKASYLNGNDYAREATHLVTAKKTVRVYKIRTGNCEANNHWSFYKYLHKGSRVYASQYFMSTGGWIIKSKNIYYHNHRTFFLVASGHWYYK
ncbi:hypothetical protein [Secundilactobacillus folii]|uniref:Uncharacterized protein n=1 Tax=Secundilactobacillus folii TaxID=2678357 RepID=A0A7X3C210_9LACO|nr:hypothetical protein [Secundilactobacillus folii]MTV81327.1 hypothetical protein [Secundilactobacillus folii]